MDQNNEKNNNTSGNNTSGGGFGNYWIYVVIALVLVGLNLYSLGTADTKDIEVDQFLAMVKSDDVEKIYVVGGQHVEVYLKKDRVAKYPNAAKSKFGQERPHFEFTVLTSYTFEQRLAEVQAGKPNPISAVPKDRVNWLGLFITYLLPIAIIVGLWMFIMRRMGGAGGGAGSQLFNIGKSRATLFDQNSKVDITFADVAGLDEAKEEVMEVVNFLKNPKKYTKLGGKIPKGVLLVGPPGTGKTLLAKAVAGEAEVPFFAISGSDFVEMFVGVGASRVRDLFRQAKEKAPCIIFIDEIDAIGRARGRGAMQGGNDERENTLNQLLVEMDGFSTDKGVILMAATNRSDVLDNALMRPGRFDRQIGIDLPDLHGREQIFTVHLKSITVDGNINAAALSEMTPGFAGADIANVCNEAALIAARYDKSAVTMEDFNYALDKVIGGLEKKNKIILPDEKQVIAYHEAGHTICGWYLRNAHPLVKVTIVPRGVSALGYAQYLPKDEYIIRTEQFLDRMCMALGGRAAEEVVFKKISTGAQSDLDQVTRMAYGMVSVYGMNEKVGNVSFYNMGQDQFNRPYSDYTATVIDEESRKIIELQYARAKQLLHDKRHELELIAQTLLEKEVLHKADVEKLIGPRIFEDEPLLEPYQPKLNGAVS